MNIIVKSLKKVIVLSLLIATAGISLKAQEMLNNERIVSMVNAKVDKALILEKIRKEKGTYDLSTNGCIQLKKLKVSDDIVAQMMQASSGLPAMSNDDVIALSQGMVSKDIILKKMQMSATKFDLNTDQLIRLKAAKVSDQVVKVMMNPDLMKVDDFSNYLSDPLAPHPQNLPAPTKARLTENGIYYEAFTPKINYIQLEPTTTNQTKKGSFGQSVAQAHTAGIAKVSEKVGLSNRSANLIIKDNRPVFYFAFSGDNRKDMNNVAESVFNGVASPNDFVLLRADVSKRGREVTIGKSSAYTRESGFTTGSVQFRYQKINNQLYKIYFDEDVPAGEYVFMLNKGSEFQSSLKLYDFSLQNNTKLK